MDNPRQAVITGVGVVSPIGVGHESFWGALLAGTSGVTPITVVDMGTLAVKFGGQLHDFDGRKFVKPRKAMKLMCREVQVGFAAATMAVEHAELVTENENHDRFGVLFGCEMLYGPAEELTDLFRRSVVDGRFSVREFGQRLESEMFPLWMLKYLPNMVACHVGIHQQAFGPNNTIVQGEASSLLALAEAAAIIERNWADVMIAGGCGNRLNPMGTVYLDENDWSKRFGDPAAACRPFDAERDGEVLGEGGAAFVLESRQHALERGAEILATVAGCASAFEARGSGRTYSGDAIRRTIRGSLRAAHCTPGEVDHVNAHGNSTVKDDPIEARAIRDALQDVPVTAPKSYFGNLGAGGGAVEMAASVLALGHGQVPPILNFAHPDAACPVNVIHGECRPVEKQAAVMLNQSLTGQAAAVVIFKAL